MLKPWTKTKAFKKWESNVKKNKTHKSPKKATDMCVSSKLCKGSKGIPRKLMPQIYNAKKFAKVIKRRFGVNTKKTTMRPKNLKPAQNEINGDAVADIIKEGKVFTNPLVVSEDNYIVDGHHRWAAARKTKPNKPIPVMVIKAPIKDALGVAMATSPKRESI